MSNKEYHKQYYLKNKEKRKAQIYAWKVKQAENWKLYKSNLKCIVCGESESCCLDFHHLDPTQKDISLAYAARVYGEERLQKELNKCVVLCSNCHRKVHAGIVQLEEQISCKD